MAGEVKTARAKGDKAQKRTMASDAPAMGFPTLDTKGQRSGKAAGATPLADDLSGTLIYTGTDMMPSVNEANPAMRMQLPPRYHMQDDPQPGRHQVARHDLCQVGSSARPDARPRLEPEGRRPRQSHSAQLQACILFSRQLGNCQG